MYGGRNSDGDGQGSEKDAKKGVFRELREKGVEGI